MSSNTEELRKWADIVEHRLTAAGRLANHEARIVVLEMILGTLIRKEFGESERVKQWIIACDGRDQQQLIEAGRAICGAIKGSNK